VEGMSFFIQMLMELISHQELLNLKMSSGLLKQLNLVGMLMEFILVDKMEHMLMVPVDQMIKDYLLLLLIMER